jgi:L-amino acid N-acyltransferase YncA
MQVEFRSFEQADLDVIRSWFDDAETARRMSYPTDEWFAYVSSDIARCWVATDVDGEVLAHIQVDRADAERGYVDLVVRPDLRGRGLGTAVLKAFVTGPGRAYAALEGAIAPDNAASLACAQRSGFDLLPEPDQDGFIRATLEHSQNACPHAKGDPLL